MKASQSRRSRTPPPIQRKPYGKQRSPSPHSRNFAKEKKVGFKTQSHLAEDIEEQQEENPYENKINARPFSI